MRRRRLLNRAAGPKPLLLAAICLSVIPCTIAGSGAEPVHSGPAVLRRTVRMKVTGYCPCPKCCGKNSDGITACGHETADGDRFVAADNTYPFGTKMIVPGYNNSKPVDVLDRGGAIHGDRLDVFFDSHKQARKWGVRHLPVKVRTD